MKREVFIMFYKIKNVNLLSEYNLLIEFQNNVKKIYDVKPLIEKYSSFKDLINIKGLFKQVKIDKGGYGISWNDNIDLSCNTLWNEGRLI